MLRRLFVVVISILIGLGSLGGMPILAASLNPVNDLPASISSVNSDALIAVQPVAAPKLFEQNCAGCHANGGNIVRRNKTLKLKDLQKNQADTVAAIATLITNGKGNLMSAYRDRLTTTEINNLAVYVLDQAKRGWKS